MASGTELSEQGLTSSIGERCPHPQIHFLKGGGGARELRRGVEVHTGIVLSRTDTEQSGPRAPVALRSFPAMSVTEARFWCSGRVRLLKFVWRGLRCTVHPEHALTSDYCINAVMHKPTVRHFVHVAAWVSATPSTCHAPALRDLVRKRATCVCRRSVCPSCAEQMTHATRWSCAR